MNDCVRIYMISKAMSYSVLLDSVYSSFTSVIVELLKCLALQ